MTAFGEGAVCLDDTGSQPGAAVQYGAHKEEYAWLLRRGSQQAWLYLPNSDACTAAIKGAMQRA